MHLARFSHQIVCCYQKWKPLVSASPVKIQIDINDDMFIHDYTVGQLLSVDGPESSSPPPRCFLTNTSCVQWDNSVWSFALATPFKLVMVAWQWLLMRKWDERRWEALHCAKDLSWSVISLEMLTWEDNLLHCECHFVWMVQSKPLLCKSCILMHDNCIGIHGGLRSYSKGVKWYLKSFSVVATTSITVA